MDVAFVIIVEIKSFLNNDKINSQKTCLVCELSYLCSFNLFYLAVNENCETSAKQGVNFLTRT